MTKRLTATFVNKTTRPGTYGDGRGGHGLQLVVQEKAGGGVRKSWVQRIRVNGKATNVGLGPVWAVTLAEAREKALDNHRITYKGGDPRATGDVPTFTEAAEKVIAIRADGWKDGGEPPTSGAPSSTSTPPNSAPSKSIRSHPPTCSTCWCRCGIRRRRSGARLASASPK